MGLDDEFQAFELTKPRLQQAHTQQRKHQGANVETVISQAASCIVEPQALVRKQSDRLRPATIPAILTSLERIPAGIVTPSPSIRF